jgi:hypothetical protein
MRRLVILLCLALTLGSVYALTIGFPDTPTFPRVPTADGTVGSILTRILADTTLTGTNQNGRVSNTLMLS